jgi:predicted HD phosphohydrolase
VRSLATQGGPFTPAPVAEFQALPYAADAVRIRRWGEAAKVPGRATPILKQYRATLLAVLRNLTLVKYGKYVYDNYLW